MCWSSPEVLMAFYFTLKHCAPAVAGCWRTSRRLLADNRAVRQAEKGGGGDRFSFFAVWLTLLL